MNENKLMALVYTNNSIAEKKHLQNVLFKIAKHFKYLRAYLNKDLQMIYDENYKTF